MDPTLRIVASAFTVPGTILVCEAELCDPMADLTFLVTGKAWEPSGRLAALVHPEDLARRPSWCANAAHYVAGQLRKARMEPGFTPQDLGDVMSFTDEAR